jgi:predicted ATPase
MNEARKLVTLSEEHSLGPFRMFGSAFLGWAQCQQGDLTTGIATLTEATDQLEHVGFRLSLAGHLANLADALRQDQQLDAARTVCDRALGLLNEGGERWLEPEVLRIAGLVAHDQTKEREKAAAMLQEAVMSARRLAYPLFDLRCLQTLRAVIGNDDAVLEENISRLASLGDLAARVSERMMRFDARQRA